MPVYSPQIRYLQDVKNTASLGMCLEHWLGPQTIIVTLLRQCHEMHDESKNKSRKQYAA